MKTFASQKLSAVIRRCVVVPACLCILAASALAQPAQKTDPRTPCQVGLISNVGNKLEIYAEGALGMAKYSRYDVVDWKLEDLVFDRVRAAVPGINVRNITFDKAELQRLRQRFYIDFESEIKDFARRVSVGVPCERYVVIHRDTFVLKDAGRSALGSGVFLARSIYSGQHVYLHALTTARLYDGQTFDLIKIRPMTMGLEPRPFDVKSGAQSNYPVKEIDLADFPWTHQQGAENAKFRDTIRSLLATSLDRTLPGLLRSAEAWR